MILEIWLFLAATSLVLFGIGIIYAKSEHVVSGKMTILLLAFLFQITTAATSFNIEVVGFGADAVITSTYVYIPLAVFFSSLALLNIAFIFFSVMESTQEAVKIL